MGFTDDETMSLQETYEMKKQEHNAELLRKEEEMRQMFVVRVKEKELELKDAEKELQQRFETLKKQHTDDKKKLDDRKKLLEDEISAFHRRKATATLGNQQPATTFTKRKK